MTFAEIWLVDFEFIARDGERPEPICLVALELCSGRLIRLWRDEFGDQPPYRTDAGVLFVAYFPAPSSAVIWPSAGRCRSECSTSMSNSAGTRMGCLWSTALA